MATQPVQTKTAELRWTLIRPGSDPAATIGDEIITYYTLKKINPGEIITEKNSPKPKKRVCNNFVANGIRTPPHKRTSPVIPLFLSTKCRNQEDSTKYARRPLPDCTGYVSSFETKTSRHCKRGLFFHCAQRTLLY